LDSNVAITKYINNEESVQINNINSNNTTLKNQKNIAATTNTTNSQQVPQESINNIINLFKEIHQNYGSSSSGLKTLETRLKKI